jgi:hypothetical protein
MALSAVEDPVFPTGANADALPMLRTTDKVERNFIFKAFSVKDSMYYDVSHPD